MEGENTEVYSWLKSLSPHLKLERLSPQFESRGFKSRRSLAFVKTEDLDTFFPSPDKLLLAERRMLEAELENIRQTDTNCKTPSSLEPKRLNIISDRKSPNSEIGFPPSASINHVPLTSIQSPGSTLSPLDRRALEHSDQLQVLSVQVDSARFHLEKKREEIEQLSPAAERRGKVCRICHKQGNNRAKCKEKPCTSVKICSMKDKHPELAENVRELQKELKMLQQALNNKVSLDESCDWRLPHLIEQFKRGHIAPYQNEDPEQFLRQPPLLKKSF
jgi:gas vesicle protein